MILEGLYIRFKSVVCQRNSSVLIGDSLHLNMEFQLVLRYVFTANTLPNSLGFSCLCSTFKASIFVGVKSVHCHISRVP